MASLNSTQTITKNHRNTSPSVKPIYYRIGVIDQKRNVAGFLSLLPSFLTMFDLVNFCSHIEKKNALFCLLWSWNLDFFRTKKNEIDEIENCDLAGVASSLQ